MAAKNAAKPRPNKNSDGQNKQPTPTMSHDIHISPGAPQAPPAPPGAPQPGHTNPMTHPAHPAIQSSMGTGPQPGTAPAGPTGAPKDQRQVQERIQFKDLPAPAQAQVEQQQGIDPYAPLKMVQQETTGAVQGGASTGPIPNMLAGPYVPPGVEAFPDDFAHLSTLMGQGFAPGATGQEHEYAQNAHALAKAKIEHAFSQAQQGTGQEQAQPYAQAPAPQPGAAPPGVSLAPGIPTGPPMGSSMGQGPEPGNMGIAPQPGNASAMPTQPGAPGGIPPALIAALLAKHKPQRP